MGCLKQTSEKTQGPSLEKIINLDHFFFLVRKIRRNTRTMYSLSGVGFRSSHSSYGVCGSVFSCSVGLASV